MTARNTFACILLLLLLFSLCLGGCRATIPPAPDIDSSTPTIGTTTTLLPTANIGTSTPTATTTTMISPTTDIDSSSPTTTAPQNVDAAPQWVNGEALLLEAADIKFSVPYSGTSSGVLAFHNGKLLFDEWTSTQSLFSLYDLATKTFTPIGELPLMYIGSGQNCLSANGRYYYTAYIPMGDLNNLSVFRADLEEGTVERIEKKALGKLMYFLYAEDDYVWRFWSEDPNGTNNPNTYIQHLDRYNVTTGETTDLLSTDGNYNISNVCVADQTLYLLTRHDTENHYTIDTFTLDGKPLKSYALAFLNQTLDARIDFTQINVGGQFVFLTSTYAGQKVVLEKDGDGFRLLQTISETNDARITGYRTNPSHNGFGYMFRSDASLIRYDKESNRFIVHAVPKNHYYLQTNEKGHLLVAYNDRANRSADYYIFENISW